MKYAVLLILAFIWTLPADAMRTRPIAQASDILAPESSSEESELLVPASPDYVSASGEESAPDEPKKVSSPGKKTCPAKRSGFKKN